MKTALTIAGSDSGAGAGIQADLKTFAAHEVYGVCAVTAVTAQNTVEVTAVHQVPADVVRSQIEAVVGDIGVQAAKTGMLANRAIIEVVAECIGALDIPSVVVDPVIVSTSGQRLLDDDAVATLRERLLPRARCVTPNLMEAELMTGRSIASVADAREAARRMVDLGARAVVVTGGHLRTNDVVDILFDGHELVEFSGPRLARASTHGTGCTFSAAIAAALAQGQSLVDAVEAAKSYVFEAIRRGSAMGAGANVLTHFPRAADADVDKDEAEDNDQDNDQDDNDDEGARRPEPWHE